MASQLDFGFYPSHLDIFSGNVSVRTLDGLDNKVEDVRASKYTVNGRTYAPLSTRIEVTTNETFVSPIPGRVFDLPKTHVIVHSTAASEKHIEFIVWILGFALGNRLTTKEYGYLDSTPVEAGGLSDFSIVSDKSKVLSIAESFWKNHYQNIKIISGLIAVIHTLWISDAARMSFERFLYLYLVFDGCHAVSSRMNGNDPKKTPHKLRIKQLCQSAGITVPAWASTQTTPVEVVDVRNESLHEALFLGEPLGFLTFHKTPSEIGNLLREMEALASRIIFWLIGFSDRPYIESALNIGQKIGVNF